MTPPILYLCNTCGSIIERDPKRLIGCNCDPNSQTWCYVLPTNEIRGSSSASWTVWR